jgi:DNA-binding transcriptional MerR regulator
MKYEYNQITNTVNRKRKRQYYIGEVANLFNANEWTIRLWANRFDSLKPRMDKKGNLMFVSADVDKIELLCKLTKQKGMTVDDVRKYLESQNKSDL